MLWRFRSQVSRNPLGDPISEFTDLLVHELQRRLDPLDTSARLGVPRFRNSVQVLAALGPRHVVRPICTPGSRFRCAIARSSPASAASKY